MENYSLLMGDSSVDEDGGGVDGEAFRGHFPVRRRAGTETPVPQILASRWRRLWKVFSGFVQLGRVFATETLSRRKGKRCEETNLVLNWEKCHFMVNEGIVLGHKISERGIEVDRAKVEAIEKMPYPRDVKGIRSILGHAGFYRRFIKDFSKISKPLTNLLQKDVPFVFDDDCKEAFETLKKALTTAPVVEPPD
ncbi:hypothetical protein QYE76_044401 [Lolium multiflorum]|uniref:Uncharacterized protein n=1 Tax=Lolium multiflorum TaxID=4521 RepID=A0AAD8WZ32_LOLMU|nr:hypothetical protein QYE76_044401 [Lolium multiflorum]